MNTHRQLAWACLAVALLARLAPAAPAATQPAARPPLKVAMFSGSDEYHSNDTLPEFKKYLEGHFNAACTVNVITKSEELTGIDQLETCDVMVLFTRRLKLPPEQVAKVQKYFEAGKPVVGIRTASHAFQTWLEYDKLVQGGDYQGHDTDKLARLTPSKAAKNHPVLAGVGAFTTPGKLYKNPNLAADVTVLLTGDNGTMTQPVAWTRLHRGGRVFYTSLGTPDDFKDATFVRLLGNAVLWAGGREADIPPAAK